MSDDFKYIVFDSAETGLKAIIFPAVIAHALMGMHRRLGTPVSAGFAYITQGEVPRAQAYGESESLKLKSVPERDSKLLDQVLRLGDYRN